MKRIPSAPHRTHFVISNFDSCTKWKRANCLRRWNDEKIHLHAKFVCRVSCDSCRMNIARVHILFLCVAHCRFFWRLLSPVSTFFIFVRHFFSLNKMCVFYFMKRCSKPTLICYTYLFCSPKYKPTEEEETTNIIRLQLRLTRFSSSRVSRKSCDDNWMNFFFRSILSQNSIKCISSFVRIRNFNAKIFIAISIRSYQFTYFVVLAMWTFDENKRKKRRKKRQMETKRWRRKWKRDKRIKPKSFAKLSYIRLSHVLRFAVTCIMNVLVAHLSFNDKYSLRLFPSLRSIASTKNQVRSIFLFSAEFISFRR